MSVYLRILLVIGSIITLLFVLHKVKQSKMQVFDTIVWVAFSVLLVLLGAFPRIVMIIKSLIGIESSVNCVFLLIIFFLIVEQFGLSVKLSIMEYKFKNAIEHISVIDNINKTDKMGDVDTCGKPHEKIEQ